MAQIQIQRQRPGRIAAAGVVQGFGEALAGDGLAHAVFAEQREQGGRVGVVEPVHQIIEGVHRVVGLGRAGLPGLCQIGILGEGRPLAALVFDQHRQVRHRAQAHHGGLRAVWGPVRGRVWAPV